MLSIDRDFTTLPEEIFEKKLHHSVRIAGCYRMR